MTANRAGAVAAAIDIGSNSIKMTVARGDAAGFEQLDWASEVVRLGHGVGYTGRLDEERIVAAIETLARFAARARALGASKILAVATEATRAAANGAMFLDRVRRETGIEVRAIDGEEEAALTFRGVAADADIADSVVIADIGGGSTELIAARDGTMRAAQSLKLGSGSLTERFVVADPPRADELDACEAEAARMIQAGTESLRLPTGGARLILVGGTAEYLGRLVPDERTIDLGAVRQVLARLSEMTAAELATEIDIPEARARVLPAGVAVVAAIASGMNPERIQISRSGIRAGLLIEAFCGAEGSNDRAEPDPGSASTPEVKVKARKRSDPEGDGREASEESFRETMKALIAERWMAVWHAIPVALAGTDIEGVHDVRVASRRLRAAMDVAAPAFPCRWYRRLYRTAKEITGALGEVRDRDVLLDALSADRDAAPMVERPGIDRLIDRVERERVEARVEMERFLRQLLEDPLWSEIERRFGPVEPRTDRPGPPAGSRS